MNAILITNGKLVNEGESSYLDILIKDGRIDSIGKQLSSPPDAKVIDALGKLVMPGMIDDQVHFREPGMTQKADTHHETMACVAGGITSYMDMPNVNPASISRQALAERYLMAERKAHANFAFYLGATNDNIDEISALGVSDACGVKVFMGASTGNMLVDNEATLNAIFDRCPSLIATHCENTPTILINEQRFRDQYGDDVPIECHPQIRSVEACYQSSSLAVELATQHDSKLHVLHITSEKELALFNAGPLAGKRITAEVCAHHLFFDESDYLTKGAQIKCNPAIKAQTDRDALRSALVEGKLDVIATDHAPHTWEEKQLSYFKAPSGLPLVQFALQSVLEHYHRGQFSLELIVEKTSHAVAELYKIRERGYLREGYWADICIVDLDSNSLVTREQVLSKCGWSPFEGYTFKSSIVATLVNGQIVFENGQMGRTLCGQRIEFGQQR